jgi:phosphoribosyl 1,2-cyclic phosphodiesterase
VPHDAAETVGYLITCEGRSVCLATDVGHISSDVLCALRGADLIVLEANHDCEMLRNGPYPAMLKRRIAGSHGHLSNPEAAEALIEAATGRPQWVWLAHLSAVNNTPPLALRTVISTLQEAGVRTMNVSVAQRDRPSVTWSSDSACCQLPLL